MLHLRGSKNKSHVRLTPQEIARALGDLSQQVSKIILAKSGNDNAWLAELIAKWL